MSFLRCWREDRGTDHCHFSCCVILHFEKVENLSLRVLPKAFLRVNWPWWIRALTRKPGGKTSLCPSEMRGIIQPGWPAAQSTRPGLSASCPAASPALRDTGRAGLVEVKLGPGASAARGLVELVSPLLLPVPSR